MELHQRLLLRRLPALERLPAPPVRRLQRALAARALGTLPVVATLLVGLTAAAVASAQAPPATVASTASTNAADAPLRFPQLSRLEAQGARVTAAVWDLDADRLVGELQGALRLTPASLSKIVIAAAALETWPPAFAFTTELRASSAPANGVVQGDLILRGSGDATLDEPNLWGLAAQLRGAGINRVTGRVLVERAPFGELRCDTVDRCNGLRRSSRAYNAAPSAIGVNYGSWCVVVRAAPTATRADVGGCASGRTPIPYTGSVQVAANGPELRVERTTDGDEDRIFVSGSIPPGTERTVHRAMSDPAAGTGLLLRSILQQIGVTVDGGVETTVQVSSTATRVLARLDGLLLQEQVGRMMRWSNNYIADVLTMGVATTVRGAPPASLADASRELTAFVERAGAVNLDNSLVMESGSGLTTTNRLSARDLVQVLRREYRDPRRFPTFYGALVTPRDAPFAYLRRGNADWLDRVTLKTGSLTEPVSVNGIAGYLRKKNGGLLAFAIIVNGGERLRQVAADTALGAARADIESLLARY